MKAVSRWVLFASYLQRPEISDNSFIQTASGMNLLIWHGPCFVYIVTNVGRLKESNSMGAIIVEIIVADSFRDSSSLQSVEKMWIPIS